MPEALLSAAKAEADKGIDAFTDYWGRINQDDRVLLRPHRNELDAACRVAEEAKKNAGKSTAELSDAMQNVLADMEEAAKSGFAFFTKAWTGLSKETKGALSGQYEKLLARAKASGE